MDLTSRDLPHHDLNKFKYTSIKYNNFMIKSTDDGTWRRINKNVYKFDKSDPVNLYNCNETICKYVYKNKLKPAFILLKKNLLSKKMKDAIIINYL